MKKQVFAATENTKRSRESLKLNFQDGLNSWIKYSVYLLLLEYVLWISVGYQWNKTMEMQSTKEHYGQLLTNISDC